MRVTRAIAMQYLPPFKNFRDVHYHLGFGNNAHLVKTILSDFEQAKKQTARLAPLFKGSSQDQTGRNIFEFLKTQIVYKEDSGLIQQIKLPSALVHMGYGDCKSFSTFANGIMANLGYPVRYRFTAYDGEPRPSHVYSVAGSGNNTTIIDGVWNRPDAEKKNFTFKKDFSMQIETISGIGCAQCTGVGCINCSQSIGAINLRKAVSKAKQVVQKVKAGAKQIAKSGAKNIAKSIVGAAPRTAFLQLVKLNVHGFATKLNSRRNEALDRWKKLGGMTGELNASINAGLGRKAIFGIMEGYNSGAINGASGIGIVAESTAALLTAAAPVIAALASLLGALKGKDPGTSIPAGTEFTSTGEGTSSAPDAPTETPGSSEAFQEAANLLSTAQQTLLKATDRVQSGSPASMPAPGPAGGGDYYSAAPPTDYYGASDAPPPSDDGAGSGLPKWVIPVVGGFIALKVFKVI